MATLTQPYSQLGAGLKGLMEDYERSLIAAALAQAGGNQRRAAVTLGVLPTTLCEKIKRLGLRQRSGTPEPAPESI